MTSLYITIGVVSFLAGFIMCALFSLNWPAREDERARKQTASHCADIAELHGADKTADEIRRRYDYGLG